MKTITIEAVIGKCGKDCFLNDDTHCIATFEKLLGFSCCDETYIVKEIVDNPAIKIIEDGIKDVKTDISLNISPHSNIYAKNILTNMLQKIKEL